MPSSKARTGLAEVREHHPDLSERGRLLAIKREWAPALSVIVRSSDEPVVADQTCDDFEIVVYEGERAPPARGRWILMLADDGAGALGDPLVRGAGDPAGERPGLGRRRSTSIPPRRARQRRGDGG